MHEHWPLIQSLFGADRPADPRIVFPVLDCALFVGDRDVVEKGLHLLANGASEGRPLFTYVDGARDTASVDLLYGIYRDRFRGNLRVAQYISSAIAGYKLLAQGSDCLAALHEEFPGNPAIARTTVISLSHAKRDREALPILEGLHSTGRMDVGLWRTLDRILVDSRDFERAGEMFRQAAASHGEDLRLVLNALQVRSKQFAIAEADRIERGYLDRFPINAEIVEAKMRHRMRIFHYQEALDIGRAGSRTGIASQATAAMGSTCLMEMGMPGAALAYLREMESVHGVAMKDGWGLLEYYGRTGRYREALEHLASLTRRGKDHSVPNALLDKWRHEIQVFQDTAGILSRIPAPREPRGVAVLFSWSGGLSHLWQGLVAAELKKAGYAIVFPCQYGSCDIEPTGDPDIDGLQGILDFSLKRLTDEPEGIPATPRFAWTIDPDNGVVAARGLNFFQPIVARIGTILRRYRFSFDHPVARATLRSHVLIADAVLALCERMRLTVARKGIPIRFLAGMSHYVPAAVMKQYCHEYGDESDMNFIAFVAAYEHYYSNLKNDRSGALSMRNLTKNKSLNGPSRVHAHEFESWAAKLDEAGKSSIRSEIMSIVNYDRARKGGKSKDAEMTLERIRKHKSAGGSVVCLFGKILYDIWMDEPGGKVHEDIVDWVNHSIDAVAGSNTILLVKPHPNETNPLLASPTEFFLDLIQARVNDNVIVCEHKWFNVGDLLPHLDLGLLWSGTAALELQACGVPVAMCSRWGLKDHPVPFVELRDREQYAALLRNPATLKVSDDVRERCWLLLKYYSTPEVMIPYGYGNMRYLRTKDIGPLRWHMDKVEEYLKQGDPHVERMAQRCF